MNLAEAKESLGPQDRARLDYDFDTGRPAFAVVKKMPEFVVGVHLDKVDRLSIVEAEGRWFLAKIRPRSAM